MPALLSELADKDAFIAFAARRALRRIDDWPAAARGLDSPDPKVREGLLLAMEDVYDGDALQQLTRFAESPRYPLDQRIKAVRFLAEVHRKAPPWDGQWWGTQPAARKPPDRTIAWEGTPRVLEAARRLLRDPAVRIRIAAIDALAEANDRDSRATIRSQFNGEKDPDVRRAIAVALGKLRDRESLEMLIAAFRDGRTSGPLRDALIEAVEMIGGDKAVEALGRLIVAKSLPTAEVHTRAIAALGRLGDPAAVPPLLKNLEAPLPAVRAAAVDALIATVAGDGAGGRRGRQHADERERTSARTEVSRGVRSLLTDPDVSVRHRAMAGAAALRDREAIPALLAAADSPDSRFEAATALAAVPDLRAPAGLPPRPGRQEHRPAPGLGHRNRQDPRSGRPGARSARAAQRAAPRGLARAADHLRRAGPDHRLAGRRAVPDRPPIRRSRPRSPSTRRPATRAAGGRRVTWRSVEPADRRGQVDLGRTYSHDDNLAAYGYAEVESPADRTAQMAIGSDDTLTVWVNGHEVYRFSDRRGFDHEQARFDVHLRKGTNRVLIHCGNGGGPWQFAVAVTAPADFAFLKGPAGAAFDPETYRAAAMKGGGDPGRGRRLFADLKGLACIKCHAVGKDGGNVGPELGSVGSKYPRDELIASVLYPSAKISSGYEPEVLALSDGRVVTGIVRNETRDAVEIQDADAKLIKVPKDDIDARKRSDVSLMPTGLAQGIGPAEFADLIAYLESLKNAK